MRTRSITALSIVISVGVGVGVVLGASSNLVGTGAIEHCGNSEGLMISCRDDEAIQLHFSNPNRTAALAIDFIVRGRNISNEHRVVEVLFRLTQPSGPVPSRVGFQVNHREYPLPTNVDSRGVAKAILPLEDFVSLAMMSPVEGIAFGKHFVATDKQMLTLRLALGRWAASGSVSK
jgi:hypothetical protein